MEKTGDGPEIPWPSYGHPNASSHLPEAPPRVLAAKEKNAFRLTATDARAAALKLHPGQALADARAICPHLDVQPADPDADRTALEAIADWIRRYTPLAGCDGADGLMLDITGCAHLFGGEAALVEEMRTRFYRLGFSTRIGIAETVGGAWAAARYGMTPVIEQGMLEEALLPLSTAALRLEAADIKTLQRLGITTVSQLINIPRAPLEHRFRQTLLTRIDQAFGRQGESIRPRLPVPDAIAERRFCEPAIMVDEILACLFSLGTHLCERLKERGSGARRFDLILFGVDGKVETLTVGTSRPLRDPERIARLFSEKLAALSEIRQDGFDTGYGFDLIRLSAFVLEPIAVRQSHAALNDNLAGTGDGEVALGDLADRLTARLGREAVVTLVPRESHIPERANVARPAVTALTDKTDWPRHAPQDTHDYRTPLRPLRLFATPEPIEALAGIPDGPPARFRWRKILRRIARVEGPERIAPEWWRCPTPIEAVGQQSGERKMQPLPFSRDYYRIEDEAGRRYWVYRDGLYARETDTPRWYMHGVFG